MWAWVTVTMRSGSTAHAAALCAAVDDVQIALAAETAELQAR